MLWEAVRKEPISHWLMLWSSSRIREARKEIGSVQPHWSKKLRGLKYIGQIRLGGSIVVHVSQLHFLVDYLLLGGRRRGFTPRASVSSSITHCYVVLVFASLFPYLLPFIFCCGYDFKLAQIVYQFYLFGALGSSQEGTNFTLVDAMVKQRNPGSQKRNRFVATSLE